MRKKYASVYIFQVFLGGILLAIIGSMQAEASSNLALTIGAGERDALMFEFRVIETSSGLVQGYFSASGPFGTVEGAVSCFSIEGNTAVFGGSNFTVMVRDDPFDTDGIIFGIGRANCDTDGFGLPIPITKGNIVVNNPDQAEASSNLAMTIGAGERDALMFEFRVIQTSSGLVQGYFSASGPFGTVEGAVSCFSVQGNTAVFGGSNFTAMAKDDPYGVDGIILGTGPERANCNTDGFGLPIPITKGNIVVINQDLSAG